VLQIEHDTDEEMNHHQSCKKMEKRIQNVFYDFSYWETYHYVTHIHLCYEFKDLPYIYGIDVEILTPLIIIFSIFLANCYNALFAKNWSPLSFLSWNNKIN
jgi:hypothetical protein